MSTSEDARIAALTAKVIHRRPGFSHRLVLTKIQICALSLRVQQLENKQLENVEAISSQNLASAGALRGNAPTFVPTSTPSEGGPGGKEKLASKDQLVPKEKSVPEEKPAGQEIRPRRERHARRERYAHNAKPATPKTQTGGRMYAFGGTETRREGQPRGERPRPKERRAPNELPATQGPSHRPETNSVFPGARKGQLFFQPQTTTKVTQQISLL